MLRDSADTLNVNKLDSKGLALLHYAAIGGSPDVVQVLTNFPGLDLQVKTRTGLTAT